MCIRDRFKIAVANRDFGLAREINKSPYLTPAAKMLNENGIVQAQTQDIIPVSYTHLDVYKRQPKYSRTEAKVEQMRRERQAAQDEANQMANAKTFSEVQKNLGAASKDMNLI